MKKKFALALAAFMMMGTLAACGSTNTNQGSDAGNTSGSSAVDAIKENGEIVMLTNAAFPPFEYLADDGSVQGVDADIAQAVADKL